MTASLCRKTELESFKALSLQKKRKEKKRHCNIKHANTRKGLWDLKRNVHGVSQ